MIHSGWLPVRASVFSKLTLVFSIGLTWLVAPASAGINTFTPAGPEGGGVNDIAYHPTDPAIVYAATNGGIYRSADGGRHWQLVHDRMVEAPRAFAVHHLQPNRVLAAAQGAGVLESDDAGVTWTALASYSAIAAQARDIQYSTDGGTLYAAAVRRVLRSTDQGNTWQAGGELPSSVNMIHTMLIDAADPNVLYVTASTESFRSTDGGLTWQPWTMPASDVQDFAMAGSRIWAASYGGTFFTDNRGTTWNLSLAGPSMRVSVDPDDPHVIYSGTFNGLQRSTDNGAHWINIRGTVTTGSSDDAGTTRSIALDASDSDHLLIAGTSGIAATFDGGAHWSASHSGIHALGESRLISAPGSDRIYVQTPYEGVFAISAADGGSIGLNNPLLRQLDASDAGTVDTYSLLVLPGSPDRLLVGLLRGVARSDDGGESWIAQLEPAFNEFVREIVSASSDHHRLLALAPSVGLFQSTDAGVHWTQLSSTNPYDTRAVVTAPSNPRTIYSIARLEIATTEYAFMRSLDGGFSWSTHVVPNQSLVAVAVDPTNDRTVYVSNGLGELHKSTNGGETWTRLEVTTQPFAPALNAIAIDPQNPNIVYAGGQRRISRSVDGGQTWQILMDDVQRLGHVASLVVDAGRPHNLYASIAARGVHQISIQPDLELTATTAAPVGNGASGAYSFRARNAGPFDATNVRTSVQLPTGATNVSATSTVGTCSVAANVITCVAPAVRVGSYADITINSTQPEAGSYALVASLESDQPDLAPGNNTVTSNVVISEVADLSVALDAPSQVTSGAAITFTLTVANAGPNAATTPTVSFALAPGLGVASVTPSTGCTTAGTTVTCQLATLAVNASTTLSIVTSATSQTGSYSGTATLTATSIDPLASNDSATRSTVIVAAPSNNGGGNNGGGNPSDGGNAGGGGGGGGGGGSVSQWMLLALLLLSAARAVRQRQSSI